MPPNRENITHANLSEGCCADRNSSLYGWIQIDSLPNSLCCLLESAALLMKTSHNFGNWVKNPANSRFQIVLTLDYFYE